LAFLIEPSSRSVGESSRSVFPSFSSDEHEEGATVLPTSPTSLSPAKVVVLESMMIFDRTMYYIWWRKKETLKKVLVLKRGLKKRLNKEKVKRLYEDSLE
jgi:hypothetical protein